ncbi:hypothetical protein [Sphingomonas sp. M1-B02]|uniref:hypothetical protein n=1 Tax=Sphingomonas sp. M1-B02 TaxID=3114300 RepID=UPI00223FC1CD|nr:hypothetical protein [Sphingomonas sp. S6-11]UZK65863.1 hypothetical protein OKW87_15335 [Sphingomonas sp. S6-11]
MEATEAIGVAKEYVRTIFADEGAFNIGLEEIEHEDDSWFVTVGFSRRWDRAPKSPFSITIEGQDDRATSRTYKIVEVQDETGQVLGVKNRPGLT